MEKLEELVRVVATIRTGLNLYRMTVRGIFAEVPFGTDFLDEDTHIQLRRHIVGAESEMEHAVSHLNSVIDLLNEEMKSADSRIGR